MLTLVFIIDGQLPPASSAFAAPAILLAYGASYLGASAGGEERAKHGASLAGRKAVAARRSNGLGRQPNSGPEPAAVLVGVALYGLDALPDPMLAAVLRGAYREDLSDEKDRELKEDFGWSRFAP